MQTKRIGISSATAVLVASFLPISDVQALEKPIGILLAAGDIATCANDETKSGKATAELVKTEIARAKAIDPNIEVRVLALGDLAYDKGTTGAFNCFNATWGQFKDKILPVPGNHDYTTNHGAAYFKYFETTLKALKADKNDGFYSLEFPASGPDAWLLLGLNSNTSTGASTTQVKWLAAELDRTKTKRCVLAFAHGFFYSSGLHGHADDPDLAAPLAPQRTAMGAMFKKLHDSRATVLIAGHDHHYEQLGRAGADASAVDLGQAAIVPDGVRSFVVGTGGKTLYSKEYQKKWAFTEAYDMNSHGILRIELFPGSYRWEFLPTKPNTNSFKVLRDIKTDACNRA